MLFAVACGAEPHHVEWLRVVGVVPMNAARLSARRAMLWKDDVSAPDGIPKRPARIVLVILWLFCVLDARPRTELLGI